ncbi:hypothetical protein QUC31_006625 [Theobroma cacao]|uniref:Cytoplasmic tRNA 2-thiolation protein 1 n=1 Tax=Theobroma cacao TaxID=3641 RepID=A0A061FTQ6_THECC|nr:Cytoplasmic tRNA 2-thiolation protein 1 [Theobroma cacao]
MESEKQNGVSFFQMPLHYPRYTQKDYQDMPEWKLDRLLAEYGLSNKGDLAYKRQFAMGAFLWPDFHGHQSPSTYISYK